MQHILYYIHIYIYIYGLSVHIYVYITFPLWFLRHHGMAPASSASSSGVLWLASSLVRSTLERIWADGQLGHGFFFGFMGWSGYNLDTIFECPIIYPNCIHHQWYYMISHDITWWSSMIIILFPLFIIVESIQTRFDEDHGGDTRDRDQPKIYRHWVPRARVQNFIHHLQIRCFYTCKKWPLQLGLVITWISTWIKHRQQKG